MKRYHATLPSVIAPLLRQDRVPTGAGILIALASVVACGSRPAPTDWPGSTRSLPISEQPAAAASRTPPDSVVPGMPRVPEATKERLIEPRVLTSLVAATDQPQESQGHEPPHYLVQVFVSPEALEAYRAWGPGSSLPKGTWLVARHSFRNGVERAGTRPTDPAPLYTMYRGPKGWLYGVVNSEGLEIPSVDGVCQQCHTQARSDSVFGPPSIAVPSGQTATSAK